MNNVLSDNRKYKAMTVPEADALLEEIVHLKIDEIKLAAAYEKRLAAVKAEFEERSEPIRKLLKEKADGLADYIGANPTRFIAPRARKTLFGSYGLRSVSNLEILNEAALIKLAREKALPLFTEVIKLDKKAVEKAISDGVDMQGAAEIQSGERSFYTVKKDLLDQAKG